MEIQADELAASSAADLKSPLWVLQMGKSITSSLFKGVYYRRQIISSCIVDVHFVVNPGQDIGPIAGRHRYDTTTHV